MICRDICEQSGLEIKVFAQRVGPLLDRNQISRNKLETDLNTHWHYFLTPKQRKVAVKKYSLSEFDEKGEEAAGSISEALIMLTDTADIPGRLSFLRNLKENTIFAKHVTLNAIIGDYERTLNLRNQVENARDMQERRAA